MDQSKVYNDLTNTEKEKINVELANIENELKLLKEQKDKLTNLLEKIKKTRDEYVSSNLSGKTYESSLRNNNLFIKRMENRIIEFTTLITKLEEACNIYNETILSIDVSIKDGKK